MKTLILFSLKRRFKNRVSITLTLFFVLIMSAIMYADKISDFFDLEFSQPYEIVLNDEMKEWLDNEELWLKQGFVFTNTSGNISMEKEGESFSIKGKTDALLQAKIKELLLNNHQQLMLSKASVSAQTWIDDYQFLDLNFDQESFSIDYLKQQLSMLLLTSLYFMMLNFIAVNSNEIILEKTSNVLALYLSCVSSFEHYLAKFISGIINVSVQIVGSLLIIASLFFIRYQDDKGSGLIKMISKYIQIPLDQIDMNTILDVLNIKMTDLMILITSILFLIIGVAIVQVLVLVVSSRVKNSEEAGAIQGPFYLILLILYYGSLYLNSSDELRNGLGYILSFVPISSMLVMPMRIVSSFVAIHELILASLISLSFLILLLITSYPIYKKGLSRV